MTTTIITVGGRMAAEGLAMLDPTAFSGEAAFTRQTARPPDRQTARPPDRQTARPPGSPTPAASTRRVPASSVSVCLAKVLLGASTKRSPTV
ncbi:hypothetical protein [Aminobacter carboxidus]|uniref:Uncharacterized protein n=1 Tax=Aminobacter carboxidus TaxID=376165 RepID=A0ABR9GNM6_9HYPH|nr:hypothetical protein [Aminobacter carboxidus]MBE1205267.1 hypothetical protein [Aminobacter carboxidus]